MATQRREQVVRLAEALEIEFEPSVPTLELMEMCITEVEDRRAHPPGQDEAEGDEGTTRTQGPLLLSEAAAEEKGAPSERPQHRAGGNGARRQRRSRAQWEAEQERRREAREAREGGDEGEAEGEAAELAPVLAAGRKGARKVRAAA